MSNSFLRLGLGMTVGFAVTYNLSEQQNQLIRNHIYLPVKKEMKEEDEPEYWTRIFT